MEILSLLASVTFVASVITFLFRKLMSKDNLKHNTKVILYSYIAMSVVVAIYPFVSIEESFRFIVMMGNIGYLHILHGSYSTIKLANPTS